MKLYKFKLSFSKGFNWRKTKKRPYLTQEQKMQRLNFSIRFLNTSFMSWLFMDETTCTTYMNRRYHMRKRSSRPRAIAITRRNCQKINIWGAIGHHGAIRFKVFLKNLISTMYIYENI